MRIAYFDSVAGASGDMFVGALLDAGAPFAAVEGAVASLLLPRVQVLATEVRSHGLRATAFSVLDRETGRRIEEVENEVCRGPADLLLLIEKSGLDERVRRDASAVVRLLAQAEAKVHGVSPEEVHFHELGALDTLVDAVAASAAFAALGIERASSSPVRLGSGMVRTAHGLLPVPAPATLELLLGVPVVHGGAEMELTTPTGAALLKHFAASFGPVPEMELLGIGYGAGTKEPGFPNVFRVMIGNA